MLSKLIKIARREPKSLRIEFISEAFEIHFKIGKLQSKQIISRQLQKLRV